MKRFGVLFNFWFSIELETLAALPRMTSVLATWLSNEQKFYYEMEIFCLIYDDDMISIRKLRVSWISVCGFV
jgi:hypothetical protein